MTSVQTFFFYLINAIRIVITRLGDVTLIEPNYNQAVTRLSHDRPRRRLPIVFSPYRFIIIFFYNFSWILLPDYTVATLSTVPSIVPHSQFANIDNTDTRESRPPPSYRDRHTLPTVRAVLAIARQWVMFSFRETYRTGKTSRISGSPWLSQFLLGRLYFPLVVGYFPFLSHPFSVTPSLDLSLSLSLSLLFSSVRPVVPWKRPV